MAPNPVRLLAESRELLLLVHGRLGDLMVLEERLTVTRPGAAQLAPALVYELTECARELGISYNSLYVLVTSGQVVAIPKRRRGSARARGWVMTIEQLATVRRALPELMPRFRGGR